MAYTEMEADVANARIATQNAKIAAEGAAEVARIQSNKEIRIAKIQRGSLWRNDSFLLTLASCLFFVLMIGFGFGQHIVHSFNTRAIQDQCLASGGTWTKDFKNVIDSHGDTITESWDFCKITP